MTSTGITKSPSGSVPAELTSMGECAAVAFARFEQGVAPEEVLTELVLPVDTVEYLWRTWARLRGAMLLSADAGRALREALYSGHPIANGDDAIAALRGFSERPVKPCPRCKSEARQYCTACPAREAARLARGKMRASSKKTSERSPSGLHRSFEPMPARGSVALDADQTLNETPVPLPEQGEELP